LLGVVVILSAAGCRSGISSIEPSRSATPAANSAAVSAPDVAGTSERALRATLVSLWEQGNYAQLDAIADQLRTQRLRFKGGAWRLHLFYDTVSSPGSASAPDAEWQAHIEKLEHWVESAQTSPTPRAALAQAYLRFAWKARGNGYANTVTPDGWKQFERRVQLARGVLDDAAKLGIHDPGTYRQMQTVALAQKWQRKRFDALTGEALGQEPGYFYFAIAEANYLLPKWYGQPGDTERYAADVADKLAGADGDALYFRIAAAVNCCKRIQAAEMSWPRIQAGFAQIEQRYGATKRQRNIMAYLALGARDKAAAQALFAQIGNDYDLYVWKTKARFDAARAGVDPAKETGPLFEEDQDT